MQYTEEKSLGQIVNSQKTLRAFENVLKKGNDGGFFLVHKPRTYRK